MSEQSPKAESEASQQLNNLPAELGLTLTPEMLSLRAGAVAAMASGDPEVIKSSLNSYLDLAETVVNQHQGTDYQRAVTGLALDKALMWRDSGNSARYRDELLSVLHLTRHPGMYSEDVALTLRQEADRLQPTLEGLGVSFELYRNHLVVNGRGLEPSDDPLIIEAVLTQGRPQIVEALRAYRDELRKSYPTVGIAPLKVMDLPGRARDILTPAAYQQRSKYDQIVTNATELRDYIQPFWQAINRSDATPDVRLHAQRVWHIGLWATLPTDELP